MGGLQGLRLGVAVVLMGVLGAGCTGAEPGLYRAPPEVPGVSFGDGIPQRVTRVCEEAAKQISVMCPVRLPRPTEPCSEKAPKSRLEATVVKERRRVYGIDFGYCYPFEQRPRRNHPRRFLHFIVLRASSPYARPNEEWERIGTRRYGAYEGVLYRVPQPSYHGDHLAFRWGPPQYGYTVSLHSWDDEDLTETLLADLVQGLVPVSTL